jgi:hypothetical protein
VLRAAIGGPCRFPLRARLNTPHHLTVLNRPSSRVRICGGPRRGFRVPVTKPIAIWR